MLINESLIILSSSMIFSITGLLKLLHINCEYEIVASYQYQVFSSKVLSVNWSDSNVFVSGKFTFNVVTG